MFNRATVKHRGYVFAQSSQRFRSGSGWRFTGSISAGSRYRASGFRNETPGDRFIGHANGDTVCPG